MKILMIANSSLGLFNFRGKLIEELLNRSNKIRILTPLSEKVYELEKMKLELIDTEIDRRGKNLFKDFKLIYKYYKNIKEYNPDLVITYTIKPNIYGGIICRILKKKYITNITGLGTAFQKNNILKKIVIYLYKVSLKDVYKVFFENESNKNIFENNKIINKNKGVLLSGSGVDLEKYKEYPLKKSKEIVFIFMGRVMKEKGIEELLYVAKQIKQLYNNVRFMILGSLEENYENRISELVDKNIIEYYGMQTDVRPFIIKAHCCVLPSYHEGMSNTLLECAAMGRPIITSDIPGCREAVLNNKSGFLHKVKDKEDLKNKIEKFINITFDEKVAMGKESRNHIVKNFNKKDVVNKTIKNLII